jgi:hypothetical protein
LASAFNAQKRKFIYAFAIHPILQVPSQELYSIPSNSTEYPFKTDDDDERIPKKQKVVDTRY